MLLPLHLNLQRVVAGGPVTTSVIASRLVNVDWKNNLISNEVFSTDWQGAITYALTVNRKFSTDWRENLIKSLGYNIDNKQKVSKNLIKIIENKGFISSNKHIDIDWINKVVVGNRILNIDYIEDLGYHKILNTDWQGTTTYSLGVNREFSIDWKNDLIENKVVNIDWANKILVGNRIFNIDYTQDFGYSPTINIDNLITLIRQLIENIDYQGITSEVLTNLTFPLDISIQKLPNGVFLLESRNISWVLNTNSTIWTLNSVPISWILNTNNTTWTLNSVPVLWTLNNR